MKQHILTLIISSITLFGHTQSGTTSLNNTDVLNKLSLKTYGVVNYYNYDWDTDQDKRNAVDLERFNMYMHYKFNDKISLKTEFEFEHGGTGSTMEFDKFEEFGEFETETEAGGEVLLEQLNIEFKVKPWFNIRAGRLKLYIGIASKLDLTPDYFTGFRSLMENTILPLGWYETGIEVFGDLGKAKKWSYKLYAVNGLSSTGFSSGNWIKRGHQKKFEMANAENIAFAGRLDYNLKNKGGIGISGYYGDSNGNRPKNDIKDAKGHVSILDFHININKGPIKFRAMALYGQLQNSDIISKANLNLSNNLNEKRTPVGSDVLGYYGEIGFDILSLTPVKTSKLLVFGRYDFYDTMFKVEDGVFKNPRWERQVITFGFNFLPISNVILKTQYSIRQLGLATNNLEKTVLIGIGYTFKTPTKNN